MVYSDHRIEGMATVWSFDIDGLIKSRHSGKKRTPVPPYLLEKTGFRLDVSVHHVRYEFFHTFAAFFGHDVLRQIFDFLVRRRVPLQIID